MFAAITADVDRIKRGVVFEDQACFTVESIVILTENSRLDT